MLFSDIQRPSLFPPLNYLSNFRIILVFTRHQTTFRHSLLSASLTAPGLLSVLNLCTAANCMIKKGKSEKEFVFASLVSINICHLPDLSSDNTIAMKYWFELKTRNLECRFLPNRCQLEPAAWSGTTKCLKVASDLSQFPRQSPFKGETARVDSSPRWMKIYLQPNQCVISLLVQFIIGQIPKLSRSNELQLYLEMFIDIHRLTYMHFFPGFVI